MATLPTREQDRACDLLATALLSIAEAARLDGRSSLDLDDLAPRLARALSAFDLDAIAARALERRGKSLGLRSGTAELITLLDDGPVPLAALLPPDDDLHALVDRLEEELGDLWGRPSRAVSF